MEKIPDYIRERILSEPPVHCCVVPCQVPQIGEGYVEHATVATVGINPRGARPRKKYSPQGECAMDEAGLAEAYEDKRKYFERRTYTYFTHLEKILNACGATYGGLYAEDDSHSVLAASLDMVQWTTDPLWSELPRRCSLHAQERLLDDGVPFFRETLRKNAQIGLLLGNGKSVVEQLERAFEVEFPKWREAELGTHLYCGELLGRQFIGWSAFLSNAPLNKAQRAQLARRVGELHRSGC